MSTHRIVLFYGFTPLSDPVAVRLWQLALGEQWQLRGRVIVSPQGINATLGGTVENLKQYVKATRQLPGLSGIDVKWSAGTGQDFPRLSVKVRPELVAFGVPEEVTVGPGGVEGGGQRLSPQALHELMGERGDDVVFFDGRNAFEAQTGHFTGAVIPQVSTTHDFVAELESGRYDDLKGRPVVTYCTGGVRCEILSVLMRNRGFSEVYQLEGGIVRYGEAFGSQGLWQGSLYVFDGRGSLRFDEGSIPLGECLGCTVRTDRYVNCPDAACTTLRLVCVQCERTSPAAGRRCGVCETSRPEAFETRRNAAVPV